MSDHDKQLQALMDRRATIDRLVKEEGWQVFMAAMQQAKEFSYRQTIEADNAHNSAKHLGGYHVLSNVVSWAQREMQAVDYQIAQLLKG